MKKNIILMISMLLIAATVYAFETSKPETHNAAWIDLHGKQALIDDSECTACHLDRTDCIACHEDVRPRDHNMSGVNKTHGMQARWNGEKCKTCHTEDSCVACHETAVPINHNRAGFGIAGNPGFHCYTSCQLPAGTWDNTISQNCIVCHKSRPVKRSNGQPHEMLE